MWFQNRRAKYRKQEKQLQKSLNPSVIPSCNSMMRNFYPTSSRHYPGYPSPSSMGAMNGMSHMNPMTSRYPQMGSPYPHMPSQFPSMSSMTGMSAMAGSSMAAMGQQQVRCRMQNFYRFMCVFLILILFFSLQDAGDEDWYNKSLRALSINSASPHPSFANPVLQY